MEDGSESLGVIRGQLEYAKEKQKQLPERKPNDKYPMIGSVAGIIAGIVFGSRAGNIFLLIGFVIAGGIIGALLGSGIAVLIIKYRRPKDNLKYY